MIAVTTTTVSIDILVGADHYWDIVTGDVIHGGNGPTAVSSKLGWRLLSGLSKQPQSNSNTFSNLILTGEQFDNSSTASDQDELTTSLKRFWEVESVSSDSIDPEIPSKQQDFVQNIRFTGARCAVGLPWKGNDIEDDYELCRNRLKSLHKKLLKDPKYLDEYNRNIEEQLATGIVEEVPPSDKNQKNIHYLPPITVSFERIRPPPNYVSCTTDQRKRRRVTTHLMTVCLLVIPQIFDLLVRFRQNPVGLVADIEKAFLMIGINKEDRNMLRFLWLKDAKDPHSEILKLRFCRLVFGLRPSPAILGATFQHHLETHEKQKPEIVEHLKKSLYVDDFVSGAENDERALEIYKGSKPLMSTGGFNLRKWSSNSDNVVKAIDALESSETMNSSTNSKSDVVQEDLSYTKSTIAKESTVTEPTQVKVLGMAWDTAEDTFLFHLEELVEYAKSLLVTKRSLLKWSSKIFDPLGFLSPFTIKLKILFQVMCLDKIDWDGELQGDARKQWNALISELEYLKTVRVPRCYYLSNQNRLITQIHGFSDASERAIGAVVYTRTVYENSRVDVKLMVSKTRVAPVKKQTIPRLELIGATLLAKLVRSVLSALEWNVEIFYRVDSMTTLHWIRNDRTWKQFVQHRVNEIRSLSPVEAWRFCPASLNPADLPSRDISTQELSNKSLWFNGPEFLVNDEDQWPKCPATNKSEPDEVLREVAKQPSNVVRSLVITNDEQSTEFDLNKVIYSNRFSSLSRLLRVTAYVLRYINALKKKRTQDKHPVNRNLEQLTASKVKLAELLWIKSIQSLSFGKEISFVISRNAKSTPALWIEVLNKNYSNILCGVIYRHPTGNPENFNRYLNDILRKLAK